MQIGLGKGRRESSGLAMTLEAVTLNLVLRTLSPLPLSFCCGTASGGYLQQREAESTCGFIGVDTSRKRY